MRPLLLLLLLLNLGGPGCVAPKTAPPPATGISFLALGDSYTIGEGVSTAERWPVQLAAMAQQNGLPLQAPDIIARTGWTTAELQAAIGEAHNTRTYGLVSLLIGVNNEYRGQSVAQYRAEFRELLRTAVGFAGGRAGHVVVLSIPDWGQSPFGQRQGRDAGRVGAEIDQFNAGARDECRQAGVALVDITPLTRAAGGTDGQFTRDGLHYSGAQMQRWAAQTLPVVRALLP